MDKKQELVLVTGGSGTVGSHVCKMLEEHGYSTLSVSRNPARGFELSVFTEHVTGDIKNYNDLACIVREHKPMGIIHCAANKHIGVCEKQPIECVESNILGTLNVIRVIQENEHIIKRAVFVSTDKAANTGSTYGMSKYIGEEMVREFGRTSTVKVNSVRMGNVFGSSGSVLPIWHRLILSEKDITLRISGANAREPRRFGITPAGAGEFICEVFLGDHSFENGSVVFPKCDVVNIGRLARVMVWGSSSRIIYSELGDVESLHEHMFTVPEQNRIRKQGDLYEIVREDLPEHDIVKATDIDRQTDAAKEMSYDETRKFYHDVVKQLGL